MNPTGTQLTRDYRDEATVQLMQHSLKAGQEGAYLICWEITVEC